MNKPIRISRPIEVNGDQSEVYEFKLTGSSDNAKGGRLSQTSAKKTVYLDKKRE